MKEDYDSRCLEAEYCYVVEDGMDGYVVHPPQCPYFGMSWAGPNPACVKP